MNTDEKFINAKTGNEVSMKDLLMAQSSIAETIKLYQKWAKCSISSARNKIIGSNIFDLRNASQETDIMNLVGLFRDQSRATYVLTKEEILKIFGDALDHADSLYFQDPLDVIIATAENIKKQGGLQAIAEKVEKVISKI